MSYSLMLLAVLVSADPKFNTAPAPNFLNSCSFTTYDNSTACTNAVLQAITHARSTELLPKMVLPSNWYHLTKIEQLFVTANLERTARGLPPLAGLVTELDTDAQGAAVADGDPTGVPSDFPFSDWGGNWAEGEGSALEADYFWMYDDGFNKDGTPSSNLACTTEDPSGCWGHRHNILGEYECAPCVMGGGYALDGPGNAPDWTELFVDTSGSPQMYFTWAQEVGTGAVDAGPAGTNDAGVGDAGELADAGEGGASGGGCSTGGGVGSLCLLGSVLLVRRRPTGTQR